MYAAAVSTNPIEEIVAKGAIGAEDVARLRREVFADGVVDRTEAEHVFRLEELCAAKDPAWRAFYVDALTDHFVWRAEPRGYVNDENAQFLIDNIVGDGRVDGVTELELLINIVHRAQSCPDTLVLFVLEAVRDSVLDPDKAVYGHGRRPHVIDPADVEIMRKVIYAGASGGGFTVTRREADLIFDLNDATIAAENAPGWRDLFVKAIANYLMFPSGAPSVPDAEEHRRREAWMEEKRGVGRLLMDVGRILGGLKFDRTWADADPLGARQAGREAERCEARLQEALGRESIDEEEARWLVDRIDEDGVLQRNERDLLAFVRENAPHVHPLLKELFAKVGI